MIKAASEDLVTDNMSEICPECQSLVLYFESKNLIK